jgi:hypothetical protein
MTWLDMANLLFEKSKALSPTDSHLHLDTAAWFRTWTPHQIETADSAARIFASRMDWPELQDEIKWQLYFRCLFAIERCIENSTGEKDQNNCPQVAQARLEKLLIEAWSLEGLQWAERKYAFARQTYHRN